jgi:phage portal protein BeeE
MLQNAGAAGIVFEKPTPGFTGMSAEQAAQLKQKVNTEVLGTDRANSIAIGNGDMGYINFGLKGSEMELTAIESLNLERIAQIYGVPPVLFNTDRSIQNNLQEAKKELVVSACFPELDSLREDWNEIAKLYAEEDLYVDWDVTNYPELQEDIAKLTETNLKRWWTTGNEKRLSEYMDEDTTEPMMDKYLIPSGLTPIDELGMNEIDNVLNGQGNNQNGNGKIPQNGQGEAGMSV